MVQTTIGNVEADLRNGSIHNRYQGYTTGAHKSDAVIGQANASGDDACDLVLNQVAVRIPRKTASPAINSGGARCSSTAKAGSLNQKL